MKTKTTETKIKRFRYSKNEKLIDEIKDAIDQLSEIKKAKDRVEAARDLISYIETCYVDYQEDA